MAKITKPDVSVRWASLGDNSKPLDSYIQTGWLAVKPPRQYFNWLDNRQDTALAYLFQAGIAEWDATTAYEGGFSYVQGSDNKVYKCIANSVGHNPITQPANAAFWVEAFPSKTAYDATAADLASLKTAHEQGTGIVNPAAWRAAIGFLQAMYPIGSLYFSATNTANPNTILGFGTWVKVEGRVLVGHDAAQTEFDTLLETGGAKTHTLTAAEIPALSGSIAAGAQNSSSSGCGIANTFQKGQDNDCGTVSFTVNGGGGAAHNNLQPYIVVSIWYRTA